MMNRQMFDPSLYVSHCKLPVSIRDNPNVYLENSTTQFVVCQKNYTSPRDVDTLNTWQRITTYETVVYIGDIVCHKSCIWYIIHE